MREWTPLNQAAWKNAVDVAKVLLAHGAKVNARDKVTLNPRIQGESVCVCV
jgi:ankyrin repeat protein